MPAGGPKEHGTAAERTRELFHLWVGAGSEGSMHSGGGGGMFGGSLIMRRRKTMNMREFTSL